MYKRKTYIKYFCKFVYEFIYMNWYIFYIHIHMFYVNWVYSELLWNISKQASCKVSEILAWTICLMTDSLSLEVKIKITFRYTSLP